MALTPEELNALLEERRSGAQPQQQPQQQQMPEPQQQQQRPEPQQDLGAELNEALFARDDLFIDNAAPLEYQRRQQQAISQADERIRIAQDAIIRQRSIQEGREQGLPMSLSDPKARELSQLELMIQESEDISPIEAFRIGMGGGYAQMGANAQQIIGALGDLVNIPGAEGFRERGAQRGEVIADVREQIQTTNPASIWGGVAAESSTIPLGVTTARGVGTVLRPAQGAGVMRNIPNIVAQAGLAAGEAGTTIIDYGTENDRGVRGVKATDPMQGALLGAVLGGGAEIVSPALSRLLRGGAENVQARRVAPMKEMRPTSPMVAERMQRNIDEAADIREATGIRLLPGQAAGTQRALSLQNALAELTDEGGIRASEAYEGLNREVSDAVDNLLDNIAPAERAVLAPERFQEATGEIIRAARDNRRTASGIGDALRQADEAGVQVDLQPVREFIDSRLPQFAEDHPARKLLLRMRRMLVDPNPPADAVADFRAAMREAMDEGDFSMLSRSEADNLRAALDVPDDEPFRGLTFSQLQSIKEILDHDIAGLVGRTGATSVTRKAGRELTQATRVLRDMMADAFEPYRVARDEFARLSPAIEALENGLVGRVSRMSQEQLDNVGGRIFKNARTAQRVRDIFEGTGQESAFYDMLRLHLSDSIDAASEVVEDVAGGTVSASNNLPRQLSRALFGNARKQRVLRAVLPQEMQQNVAMLRQGLRRAGEGWPGGSRTAGMSEIISRLKDGVGKTILRWLSPRSLIVEVGGERRMINRSDALSEIMFNPDWQGRLAEVRRSSGNGVEASRLLEKLLNDAANTLANDGGANAIMRAGARRPEEAGEGIEMVREGAEFLGDERWVFGEENRRAIMGNE